MATDLLIGFQERRKHRPHHDLEGFFYLLLWMCLTCDGPCGTEREDNVFKRMPVDIFLDFKIPITTLGARKLSCMTSLDKIFEFNMTRFFTDYFQDLIPCINELRHRIFPIGMNYPPDITHEDMIDILQKHLDLLPVSENWSKDREGSRTGKRKLACVDEGNEEESTEIPPIIKDKRARTDTEEDHNGPTD